ncbi:MAG TPA: hypothetical protein VNW53_11635 [Phenylobacterium sp.]|jgi:hypothetical protein|uniref:hypothetical protein n=1 Tax=Phenylobacterium sp. TaxID=1871053 RepID=UPI002BF53771|nr:hypothetical protein [Phenylobacterium sp.]HXA39644.1 hypothetical protein [Phenylobacterium sp.]
MVDPMHCAATVTELADVWCRMDAHEGQAAWAQAFGVVAAILASAGFALWVPLHMRSVECRSECLRAKRAIQRAIEMLAASVISVGDLIKAGEVGDGTARLQDGRVRQVRLLLDGLPRFSLGPAALSLIDDVDGKCIVVDTLITAGRAAGAAAQGQDPQVAGLLQQMEDVYAIAGRLRARRVQGDWLLDLPEGDPDAQTLE